MREETHLKYIVISAFLSVTVLSAGTISKALGASYKAIDLNPSGFTSSYARGISGTQQVGYGAGSATGGFRHALLWNGSADSFIDLNPSGFTSSYAQGISGTQQVGYGYGSATGGFMHALLWNGSADSFIDLNPSGFTSSYAQGISGTQQVGYGYGWATGGPRMHALRWNGSASSYVDLHPSGFDDSFACGTNGTQQVGFGNLAIGYSNALLWSGSADSCVHLNPSGFRFSVAYGTNGTQQVGCGRGSATGNNTHALLWSGTAASRVDLNPSGFSESEALGISGTQQVGYGYGSATGGNDHALLWSGSADSFIDLHQFLPTGFYSSYATAIDGYGNIVGYAYDNSDYGHAILWQVPEPAVPPVACIVGGDRAIEAGSGCEARIILDGSCSSDEDSTPGTNDDINDFDWFEVIDPCDPNSDIFLGTGQIIECNLPLGEHIIILEVIDKADAFDANEVSITVEDTTPPEISCPADVTVAASNPAGTVVTFTATATDLCDSAPEVICSPAPESMFPCGTTEVICTATDSSGNSSSCTFTVTVIEPIESQLWVSPRVINRRSRMKKIMAIVKLPEGILRDDIDEEVKLLLYPAGVETDGISAMRQYILGGRGRRCRNVRIIAFFDKDKFTDAVPEDGKIEVYVTGRLKSGQYFYGSDTVWVRSWRWRHWWPWHR